MSETADVQVVLAALQDQIDELTTAVESQQQRIDQLAATRPGRP